VHACVHLCEQVGLHGMQCTWMRVCIKMHGCACSSRMHAQTHAHSLARRHPTRACTCVCTYMRMYVYPQAWKANRHKKGDKGMPGVGRQIVARLQTLPFSLSGTFLDLDVI
jgi:hypothetical protein